MTLSLLCLIQIRLKILAFCTFYPATWSLGPWPRFCSMTCSHIAHRHHETGQMAEERPHACLPCTCHPGVKAVGWDVHGLQHSPPIHSGSPTGPIWLTAFHVPFLEPVLRGHTALWGTRGKSVKDLPSTWEVQCGHQDLSCKTEE